VGHFWTLTYILNLDTGFVTPSCTNYWTWPEWHWQVDRSAEGRSGQRA